MKVSCARLGAIGFCSKLPCVAACPAWGPERLTRIWEVLLRLRPGLNAAQLQAWKRGDLRLRPVPLALKI
eukprot:871846-Alexandrium_andersonii.AAC.1